MSAQSSPTTAPFTTERTCQLNGLQASPGPFSRCSSRTAVALASWSTSSGRSERGNRRGVARCRLHARTSSRSGPHPRRTGRGRARARCSAATSSVRPRSTGRSRPPRRRARPGPSVISRERDRRRQQPALHADDLVAGTVREGEPVASARCEPFSRRKRYLPCGDVQVGPHLAVHEDGVAEEHAPATSPGRPERAVGLEASGPGSRAESRTGPRVGRAPARPRRAAGRSPPAPSSRSGA